MWAPPAPHQEVRPWVGVKSPTARASLATPGPVAFLLVLEPLSEADFKQITGARTHAAITWSLDSATHARIASQFAQNGPVRHWE